MLCSLTCSQPCLVLLGACPAAPPLAATALWAVPLTRECGFWFATGDVVVLLRELNSHLDDGSITWYKQYLIPLLQRHGASLVLAHDWYSLAHPYCSSAPESSQCTSPFRTGGRLLQASEELATEYAIVSELSPLQYRSTSVQIALSSHNAHRIESY